MNVEEVWREKGSVRGSGLSEAGTGTAGGGSLWLVLLVGRVMANDGNVDELPAPLSELGGGEAQRIFQGACVVSDVRGLNVLNEGVGVINPMSYPAPASYAQCGSDQWRSRR